MTMPNGPKLNFANAITRYWSTIVPVHRKRDGLKRCLKSVLDQMTGDHELLVVDHSPDNAGQEVVNDLVKSGHVLGYHRVEPQGRMALDWNRAIEQASGRWIHLMHDDDWLKSRFYESLDYNKPNDAVLCATGYENQNQLGRTTFVMNAYPMPLWPSVVVGNPFQPIAYCVSRAAYEEFGGYNPDPDLRHCPDWEFLCRVLSVKWAKVHLHGEALAVHTEGSSVCESAAPFTEQIESYRHLYACLHEWGVQRDAIVAGLNNLIKLVSRKAITSAADMSPDWLELFNLTVSLERQRRLFSPEGK